MEAAGFLPVVGQVLAAGDTVAALQAGQYVDAAASATGLIPGGKTVGRAGVGLRRKFLGEGIPDQPAEFKAAQDAINAKYPDTDLGKGLTPKQQAQLEQIRKAQAVKESISSLTPDWVKAVGAGVQYREQAGLDRLLKAEYVKDKFTESDLTKRQNEDARRAKDAGLGVERNGR